MDKKWSLWAGVGFIAAAACAASVLIGYHASDPSLIHVANHALVVKNFLGVFGAWLAGLMLYMFGGCSWLLILLCGLFGYSLVHQYITSDAYVWRFPLGRVFGLWLASLGMLGLCALWRIELYRCVAAGGKIGFAFAWLILKCVDWIPALAIMIVVCLVGLVGAFGVAPWLALLHVLRAALAGFVSLGKMVVHALYRSYAKRRAPVVYSSLDWFVRETVDPECSQEKYQQIFADSVLDAHRDKLVCGKDSSDAFAPEIGQCSSQTVMPEHASSEQFQAEQMPSEQILSEQISFEPISSTQGKSTVGSAYRLPTLALVGIGEGDEQKAADADAADQKALYETRAKIVEEKLRIFGVDGRVVEVVVGPVVVVYEFLPAMYVKVSRILAFEDDLALALQAHSLRIIAPVPGKSTVRFEVSKDENQREVVRFSSLLGQVMHNKKLKEKFVGLRLPLVLGRSVRGEPVFADLASMPHALVAGTTGSGKSVVLHSCIASLLWAHSPDTLGIIMIDPKQLECAVYAKLPHMIFPPICRPADAVKALRWLVSFMEQRYQDMAQSGARNIDEYIRHIEHQKQTKSEHARNVQRVVVIVDELADLMLTAGKDVELLLVRLAQMGRAAGIHLLVATQRPSVDIVTGLIKANFPARLALKVSSKIDSRIIIDAYGAQTLLGKGDMLFVASDGECVRVHGSYLNQDQLERIIDFHALQRGVSFHTFDEFKEEGFIPGSIDEDELFYDDVKRYVTERDEISISQLQRQFRIGFNRSARLVEMLERDGLISPAHGSKSRKVLR